MLHPYGIVLAAWGSNLSCSLGNLTDVGCHGLKTMVPFHHGRPRNPWNHRVAPPRPLDGAMSSRLPGSDAVDVTTFPIPGPPPWMLPGNGNSCIGRVWVWEPGGGWGGWIGGWICKSRICQQILCILVSGHLTRLVRLTGFSGHLSQHVAWNLCDPLSPKKAEPLLQTHPSRLCPLGSYKQDEGPDGPRTTHWNTLKTWALERMTQVRPNLQAISFPGVPCILDASRIGISSHSSFTERTCLSAWSILHCWYMSILDTAILGIIMYHLLTSFALDRSRDSRSWALSELSSQLQHQCDREASGLVIWRVWVAHLMDHLVARTRTSLHDCQCPVWVLDLRCWEKWNANSNTWAGINTPFHLSMIVIVRGTRGLRQILIFAKFLDWDSLWISIHHVGSLSHLTVAQECHLVWGQ